MTEYVKPKLTLFEQSSSPATPVSSTGEIYCKSDGKLYFKNDSGTETELTLASIGDGIDEHVFPLADFYKTNALASSTNPTGSRNISILKLDNVSPSTLEGPTWRLTQAIIDKVAAGKKIYVEVDCSSAATGATDILCEVSAYDDSAASWSVSSVTKTVTISSVKKPQTVRFEFSSLAPAFNDKYAVRLYRGSAGTLANSLDVHEVRMIANTTGVS